MMALQYTSPTIFSMKTTFNNGLERWNFSWHAMQRRYCLMAPGKKQIKEMWRSKTPMLRTRGSYHGLSIPWIPKTIRITYFLPLTRRYGVSLILHVLLKLMTRSHGQRNEVGDTTMWWGRYYYPQQSLAGVKNLSSMKFRQILVKARVFRSCPWTRS